MFLHFPAHLRNRSKRRNGSGKLPRVNGAVGFLKKYLNFVLKCGIVIKLFYSKPGALAQLGAQRIGCATPQSLKKFAPLLSSLTQ